MKRLKQPTLSLWLCVMEDIEISQNLFMHKIINEL